MADSTESVNVKADCRDCDWTHVATEPLDGEPDVNGMQEEAEHRFWEHRRDKHGEVSDG